MSVNGAVWGRVRRRLRAFPEHLAACGAEVRAGGAGPAGEAGWVATLVRSLYRPVFPQASAYGQCVQASTAPGGRLSKNLCVREFEALRSCFAAAVGGRVPAASSPSGGLFSAKQLQ